MSQEDIALTTLMTLIEEKYPNVDRNLVKKLYETQKAYQFNPDVVSSSQAMKTILESEIDKAVESKDDK